MEVFIDPTEGIESGRPLCIKVDGTRHTYSKSEAKRMLVDLAMQFNADDGTPNEPTLALPTNDGPAQIGADDAREIITILSVIVDSKALDVFEK